MSKFMEMFRNLTEEEKAEARELLGINKVSTSGARINGKLQRTEKVLETKVAQQMRILIDTLPADRSVDVKEWTELALKAGLQTQQDPVRITMYYKKAIVDAGYAQAIN